MREIKFRAWDGKEMWRVTGVQFANNSDFVNLYGTEPEWIATGIYEDKMSKRLMFMSSPDCVLMQYTGLKDKNGVEIYEGDILEYRDSEYSFHAAVEWGDHGYVMSGHWLGGGKDNFNFDDNEPQELEVIGNIYENPELLNT